VVARQFMWSEASPLRYFTLALMFVTGLVSTAEAGHRNRNRQATPLAAVPTCATGTCQSQSQATVMYPAGVYTQNIQTQISPNQFTQTQTLNYQGDSPEAFLQALNAHRARNGRGPVGWDSNLAATAATNNIAGHAPHSMRGAAGQCWASGTGYLSALQRWIASPSHNAILLNATSAVGCSPCPSGMTLNTR